MNFAALLARIMQILPFATQIVQSIETLVGPGKITSEAKTTALRNAVHEGIGTAAMIDSKAIPDPAGFNAAVDYLVSGAIALHTALQPKKPAI